MLIRVDYQFPEGSEIRYDERAPSEGSTVRHNGVTWRVDIVDVDTTGGYIVRLSLARRLRARDTGNKSR